MGPRLKETIDNLKPGFSQDLYSKHLHLSPRPSCAGTALTQKDSIPKMVWLGLALSAIPKTTSRINDSLEDTVLRTSASTLAVIYYCKRTHSKISKGRKCSSQNPEENRLDFSESSPCGVPQDELRSPAVSHYNTCEVLSAREAH